MTENTTWSQIWADASKLLKPELLEYMTLSPNNVSGMLMQSMRTANPAQSLADMLNEHGQQKKDARDRSNEERKRQDAEMLLNASRWPMNPIRLKTQPWVTPRRYGSTVAYKGQASGIVIVDGQPGVEEFGSIKDMVEIWSVD